MPRARIMTDSTDSDVLYGPQTTAAIANFGASGEQMPAPLMRALAAIKAEAAVVNAQKADGFDHTVAAAVRDAADDSFQSMSSRWVLEPRPT